MPMHHANYIRWSIKNKMNVICYKKTLLYTLFITFTWSLLKTDKHNIRVVLKTFCLVLKT